MQYAKNDKDAVAKSNPFPGLRPFHKEESHLFFGREKQVSEVLTKLKANKFVGIVGNSGIGKSSFVNCGIFPELQEEKNQTQEKWTIISFRPGAEPLSRLSDALKREIGNSLLPELMFDEKQQVNSTEIMSEVASSYYSKTGNKLLIYIDQFEEIFRFSEDDSKAKKEITIFIDIIINSIKKTDEPINVITTIRSDFVGDCSAYPALTKAINDSQFLIPQMTKAEKRAAIVRPVEVMGAKIDDDLVETILQSIGNSHDQLPLMQHALMRTWDYWANSEVKTEPISLNHYHAIGGMEKALSVHANEIFNQLEPDKKKICERLFKSITEKGSEGRSVRRPTSIKEIAAIANAEITDVKYIVEHFRKPGRTLLTPSTDIPLREDTIIDISHESLMRIWEVLNQWLEEEHEAIKQYLTIAEAAENHQSGKGGLLKSPELQMALNWQQENNPTKEWGVRHDRAYDRTMQYLAFSEKKFLQEQRLKEKMQKLRLVVFKSVAVVFGLGAIVALAFFFYAQRQREEAQKQQMIADEQKEEARKQAEKAELNAQEAFRQKQIAEKETQKAIRSQQVANEKRKEAMHQRKLAEKERQFALKQKNKATQAQEKASKLRILSVARSMAVKSLQESDKILKSLSARQAYNLFENNGGRENDPDIYNALYFALKKLKGDDFNKAKAHRDNVRALVTRKGSKFIYSAGSDGRIYQWKKNGGNFIPELINEEKGKVHKAIAVSHDGSFLVVGGNYPYLKMINLDKNKTRNKYIDKSDVQHLTFTPDDKSVIYLNSNKQIVRTNFQQSEILMKSELKINSMDLSPDGQVLAVGRAEGSVLLINLVDKEKSSLFQSNTNEDITSVEYSINGNFLAVGDMTGIVRLIDPASGEVKYNLSGHKAMVNQIAYSHSGNRLATASFDHSVRIWSLNNPYRQPIILNDHEDWVWSVEFTQNDKYLLAGCRDNLVRTWLLDIDKMASMICEDEHLNRNFTQKEWDNYVAEDIDYQCTCSKYSFEPDSIRQNNKHAEQINKE
jgi:WD40 repeat protein/energy-coupling factor transporter ATP-binding protein EcfA2